MPFLMALEMECSGSGPHAPVSHRIGRTGTAEVQDTYFSISGVAHVNALPDLQGRGAHLTEASLLPSSPSPHSHYWVPANHRQPRYHARPEKLGGSWWPAPPMALLWWPTQTTCTVLPQCPWQPWTLSPSHPRGLRLVLRPKKSPALRQPLFPPTLVSSNKVLAF